MWRKACAAALLPVAAAGCGAGEEIRPVTPALPAVQELIVASDYGQIYVYDPSANDEGPSVETEDDNTLLRALDDAYESRRFVGYDTGLVDIVTPSQANERIPVRLEIRDGPPPLDLTDWDHVVEVPLPLPSGRIAFEASGGGPRTETTVTPAVYRARVSGRGFKEGVLFDGDETYRLQLWPAPRAEPKLLKYWSGYDANIEAGD